MMPINKKEVSKYLYFKIPKSVIDQEDEIKNDIGDFVLKSILDSVADGKSPIDGSAFKTLTKKYAANEKKGSRTPNLELEGDMLSALEYETTDKGIKIGIMDENQAIKAYAHCTGFKGHPWLDGVAPERKFIPSPKEDFEKSIMKEIGNIIQGYVDASENNEEVQDA